MRYRRLIVYFFTALLLAIPALSAMLQAEWDGSVTLTAVVTVGEREQQIRCWNQQEQDHILFLPGNAELSQIKLSTNTENQVWLGDTLLTEGISCQNFQLNTPYPLVYENRGERYTFTLTLLQASRLPAMYIDVASGSMDHIHQDRDNEEPGTLRIYSAEGALDYEGDMESLKGRGSSTWEREKRPYNLTLSSEGDLLGMGKAERWILLANAMDPSNLRNKLVYDFAQELGMPYTPECRWVDLYLNGEYAGLYLLTERNEVHSQRVALEEVGSFLVSKEAEWRMDARQQPYIMTEADTALRIHYSDLGSQELLELWQSAENAILAEDGVDPVTGKHWTELIDGESWARKLLLEEVLGNSDGGTLSQYFYRSGTDRICAGPIWDYDLALANRISQPNPVPNTFFALRENLYGSKWFHGLYQHEEFFDTLVRLYETEFRQPVQQLLDTGIDAYARQIEGSSAMNNLRWRFADDREETEHIKAYLAQRLEFLDQIWLEQQPYLEVYVTGYDNAFNLYLLRPGDTVPGLQEYESNDTTLFYGWYHTDTQQPFDPAEPVWEDIRIYLKYETRQ